MKNRSIDVRIIDRPEVERLQRKVEVLSQLIEEAFRERNQAVAARDTWKDMYYDTNRARLRALAERDAALGKDAGDDSRIGY